MKILDFINSFNPLDTKISQPYIIAEAGVNHEGKMELAKRLIDEAKEGGADAIKFQTYKADTIASKNSPAYWDLSKEPTTSQYELFTKHDSFWKKEFVALKEYCDSVDIEFMSTPFDIESATFLNELMPVFKISSSDITNRPFIEYMCKFQKPVILSTGASYLFEIEEAVEWIQHFGVDLTLMHCVLNYPTMDENAGLGMISVLKRKFPGLMIGYSDHTLPKDMQILETAALLGAVMIEKHFTFDKSLPGNDHYHAMDYKDLQHFRERFASILDSLGNGKKELSGEDLARRNARRSLVAKRDIKKNSIITEEDLTWKRPAYGISPKHYYEVLGKKALRDIEQDELLYWNLLS